MLAWEEAQYNLALKRARDRRWSAPGKSTVRHPKYGRVVVPHASKLAALDNAAEYWGCGVSEIIREATVMQYQRGDGPLVRPKEFCGRLIQIDKKIRPPCPGRSNAENHQN